MVDSILYPYKILTEYRIAVRIPARTFILGVLFRQGVSHSNSLVYTGPISSLLWSMLLNWPLFTIDEVHAL